MTKKKKKRIKIRLLPRKQSFKTFEAAVNLKLQTRTVQLPDLWGKFLF